MKHQEDLAVEAQAAQAQEDLAVEVKDAFHISQLAKCLYVFEVSIYY